MCLNLTRLDQHPTTQHFSCLVKFLRFLFRPKEIASLSRGSGFRCESKKNPSGVQDLLCRLVQRLAVHTEQEHVLRDMMFGNLSRRVTPSLSVRLGAFTPQTARGCVVLGRVQVGA